MPARALHVILVHFNPRRLKVRSRLFREAARRFERDGAIVWRVEAAFGGRPFEVTSPWRCRDIQVRTNEEVWNKEALINIGAKQAFQDGAKAVAWIDADIEFARRAWVHEALCALDHYPVVQLFSDAIDLNPKYGFMGRAHGFAKLWNEGQRPGDFEKNKAKYPSHMHPGYGWAWTKAAWKAVGGMLTCGVLGSGDSHMAAGLVGVGAASVWPGVSPDYLGAVEAWGQAAFAEVRGNIGFVEGLILHHFHGYKEHRGYGSRVDILRKHQFSPKTDLVFTPRGMPRLTDAKPGLRQDIARYMGSRREYDLSTALEAQPKHPAG